MSLMHSTIHGTGHPLVILHGFLGMSDNWKTLGKKFGENGFEVHLVDQRNHGRSFWSDNFSYDLMAEDLRHYLEHHKLSDVVLLGHSMGGKTAMEFAVSNPDKLKALLVADISPRYYPPHHQYIINALNHLDFDELESRTAAEEVLAAQLEDPGIRQFLLKNLFWAEKGKLGFRANLDVLSAELEEIGAPISATGIYAGPALFLAGDRSEYIAPQDTELIKTYFPNATFTTIPNAGHWLHAENPIAFYEACMAFLTG